MVIETTGNVAKCTICDYEWIPKPLASGEVRRKPLRCPDRYAPEHQARGRGRPRREPAQVEEVAAT